MGQSAEELRREIEQTRAGLGDTLEAIGDRVSPGRVIERRKNRVTGGIRSARERVMGTVSNTGHAVMGTVSGTGHAITGTGQAVMGTTHDMAHSVREGVSGTAHSAVDAARDMPQMAKSQAQGSPMAAGAVAFGLGFLAAAVIPPSQKERQAASGLTDKIEPLKEQLSSATHEIVDHLREPAMEAAGAVKETAAQGAQSVAGTAKDEVQVSKEQAQQSVNTVKGDATSSF